jgi:hypothetical protein
VGPIEIVWRLKRKVVDGSVDRCQQEKREMVGAMLQLVAGLGGVWWLLVTVRMDVYNLNKIKSCQRFGNIRKAEGSLPYRGAGCKY